MARKPKTPKIAENQLRRLCKNHSIAEVAAILGCHRVSIYRWVWEYGIIAKQEPRRYDIPSGYKLRQLATTHTDSELAEQFGCSEQTIRTHRHADGIYRSRVRRRYLLNEDFFEKINTEEKAYTLGFLAADGTVPLSGRCVVLMLHAKDEHILRDIRKAMGSTARIFERKQIPGFPNRGPYKFVYFSSQKLVADLATHGITPRKSFTLQYPPALPKRLERHYMRGLLDGDGSIKEKSFYFLGTEALIDRMQSAIFSHTKVRLSKTYSDGLCRLTGGKPSKQVLHWLYAGASIFLVRKHQRFLDYWQ